MATDITACQITSEIVYALAAVAESIGRLEGVTLIQPSPQLRRKNRIRTIQASLAIGGNSLTRHQITALLDKKRVIGPSQDILAVQNAIIAYHRLAEFNPLSMDSMLQAHAIMMKGLMAAPGSLRQGPIGVTRADKISHEAPRWDQVESMMQALFHYLNVSDDHPLIKSCRFHFELEHIHPFIDGNGRVGRFWQTRLLMLYHPVFEYLSVEPLIRERRQAYYAALATGDDTGDCTVFVAFVLAQIKKSLHELIEETRGVTLTAENRLGIARAAFGDDAFSRRAYQNVLKTISTATASRDLRQGVEMGILIRSGDKRTSVYRFEPVSD
jgi:Fic family protein